MDGCASIGRSHGVGTPAGCMRCGALALRGSACTLWGMAQGCVRDSPRDRHNQQGREITSAKGSFASARRSLGGGRYRIRTYVGISQLIYSQSPLAARVICRCAHWREHPKKHTDSAGLCEITEPAANSDSSHGRIRAHRRRPPAPPSPRSVPRCRAPPLDWGKPQESVPACSRARMLRARGMGPGITVPA